MEADWEVEIGGNAPVIEAYWPGFVDLQSNPARAHDLMECRQFLALAEALIALNGQTSPVWTSKADVFVPERVDPDELNAEGSAESSLACYIDWLPRNHSQWTGFNDVEADCRRLCERLHAIELQSCRIDLVIRAAHISAGKEDFGVTAYLTACGMDADAASSRLSECLAAFANCHLLEA